MQQALTDGETDAARLIATGQAIIDAEPLARFEHLELVDPDALTQVTQVKRATQAVIAVWFGDVRLIDNRRLAP